MNINRFMGGSLLVGLALWLGAPCGWGQSSVEDPWVVPIEQPAMGHLKRGLIQSTTSGLAKTGEPSVKDRLNQLNASEWAILQALEVKGYLPESDLQSVVLPNIPSAQTNALLDNLVAQHLIRTAGVEPQRMLMLSESLLKALTGVTAPKDPVQSGSGE